MCIEWCADSMASVTAWFWRHTCLLHTALHYNTHPSHAAPQLANTALFLHPNGPQPPSIMPAMRMRPCRAMSKHA